MEEIQLAIQTKCANCYQITRCYDDGEAYICINREMCKKNARIATLEADLTAALNLAEASARQCEKLRSACRTALDWLTRFGEDAPIMFGGEAELYDTLRAALAPEEPPDA